jgi:DNA-binding LytR/AlgR family response regulator
VEDLKIYGFVFGKRNCLLDITKIKSVNSKNNTVTMKNDENLTISRQKLASLRQLLKKHENHSRS